jgi:phosphoserine aminotransferase
MKPDLRPGNPNFSSGPCTKRPGWTPAALDDAFLGRSHRSKNGKARLKRALDETRALLGLPDDYLIGIVPASDTGAVEMALWSLLGAERPETGDPRPVDVLAWESFGKGWAGDIQDQLKLDNFRLLSAPYGELPDLSAVNPEHDIVFPWNGTTSGVRVPSSPDGPGGEWISDARQGLTICDATSAVFAVDLPWAKLDVVTYSWQKVLGGEAAHGMLILSPRAVERLESYTPPWPMPKIFRLTKGGKLITGIFTGATINTPSMLALEDYLDALKWAREVGGLAGLIARSDANAKAISDWVAESDWVDHLAARAATRSTTSVCLKITDPWFAGLSETEQRDVQKRILALLEAEKAGYDLGAYRDAPPGLRLWAGATIETTDLQALFPWLDWAFEKVKGAA